jgi:hypothetical protein
MARTDADPDGITERDRHGVLDRRNARDLDRFQGHLADQRVPLDHRSGGIHADALTPDTGVTARTASTAVLYHPDPSSRAPRGHSGR